MATQCKVFTMHIDADDTATTTIAETGIGFTPELALISWGGSGNPSDEAAKGDIQLGFGVALSTTERFAIGSISEDAQSSSDSRSGNRNDVCVLELETGTFGGQADVSEMSSADGGTFEIVIDSQFNADLEIVVIVVEGDAVANAAVGGFVTNAGTGDQTISSLPFTPEFALFAAGGNTVNVNAAIANLFLSLGVMNATGEWVVSPFSRDGRPTTVCKSYSRLDECIVQHGNFNTVGRASAAATRFDTNQFTISIDEAASHYVHYLILAGGDYHVDSVATPTDTNEKTESGWSFTPSGLMFASHCKAESASDTRDADMEMSIGFATASEQAAINSTDVDAAADSATHFAIDHDSAVYLNMDLDTSTPALEGVVGVNSLESDGFKYQASDADPAAALLCVVGFGPGGATIWDGVSTMTAAGVVTVVETAIRGAVSAMTGAGVVTVAETAIRSGVVSMTGSGTLTSVATTFYPAVCAMTGSGVVTVAAGVLRPGVSSMTGSGVVTVAETALRSGVVSMTGSGVVTVAETVIRSAVVAMTGTGTLTADATVITSAKVGTCSMTGSGTVTVAETAIRTAIVSMTGAGTVTAVTSVIRPATVSMAGSGTLTSVAIAFYPASCSMTGSGILTSVATTFYPASCSMVASGTLTSVATTFYPASCSMTGSGTVTAVAGAIRPAIVAMTGAGVVTVISTAIRSAVVAMTGSGTLTASATVISGTVWAGVCSMVASGTLTVAATIVVPAGVRIRVSVAAQDRTLGIDAHSRSVVAAGPSRTVTVFDDNDGTA